MYNVITHFVWCQLFSYQIARFTFFLHISCYYEHKEVMLMNGRKLKSLREKKGLLQKELGDKLNISASTIGMYEQDRRDPDFETLKKIANFFNVSTDYLLDNTNNNNIDEELKEKEALKNMLKKAGFMSGDEDLTDEELKKLIEYVNAKKKFLKGDK